MTKFCKECKHFKQAGQRIDGYCHHPIRFQGYSEHVSIARQSGTDPCGWDGKQYEQYIPPRTVLGTIKAILSGFKSNSKGEGV